MAKTGVGVGIGALIILGAYFGLSDRVELPEPLCTQEMIDAYVIQVPEACDGLWAKVCNESGFVVQECFGGEADMWLLQQELFRLQEELRQASSTYELILGKL